MLCTDSLYQAKRGSRQMRQDGPGLREAVRAAERTDAEDWIACQNPGVAAVPCSCATGAVRGPNDAAPAKDLLGKTGKS